MQSLARLVKEITLTSISAWNQAACNQVVSIETAPFSSLKALMCLSITPGLRYKPVACLPVSLRAVVQCLVKIVVSYILCVYTITRINVKRSKY